MQDRYDHGFGDKWTEVYVHSREGYSTSVTDYHKHGFYEINLILSGNVRILFGDRAEEGSGNCIVLTRPGTLHYVSCKGDTLYRRIYLNFTEDFVRDHFSEWHRLSAVFGEYGSCFVLTSEETERLQRIIAEIGGETSPLRKRLLICYLLSLVSDLAGEQAKPARLVPTYVLEALAYLERNYDRRITAEELARQVHVGRTTLMTEFKKYTGNTLGEYLTHRRIRHASRLLSAGETLEYTASACGFSDSSGLIRAFKRLYGMTPCRYLEQSAGEQKNIL